MKLYEIDERLIQLLDEIDEDGCFIHADEIEELEMAKEAKIENMGLWIKNLEADAKAIKEEEKALADRRKAIENRTESLKKFLQNYLAGSKFETARIKISYRKSEAVEIIDMDLIGEGFKVEEITVKADKKAIKEAIKSGQIVGGVELVEKQNMQIK